MKLAMFYVYNDEIDPYIIIDPPDNLGALLREWNIIDAKYVDSGDDTDWMGVDEWLIDHGVNLVRPSETIYLSEF